MLEKMVHSIHSYFIGSYSSLMVPTVKIKITLLQIAEHQSVEQNFKLWIEIIN